MDDTILEMVPVTINEKEVFIYEPSDETSEPIKKTLGRIVSRVFEGESIQRHFYIPEIVPDQMLGNRGHKIKHEYSLGPTTDSFTFTDHSEVLEPLINRGYELRSIRFSKGGLKLWSLLTPPDAFKMGDPINWDQKFWSSGGNLMEAVQVTSSIGPGMGINYQWGWFRVVCTNGLISRILGLGGMSYSHTSWGVDKVFSFLDNHRLSDQINPPIGSRRGVKRTAEILASLDDEEQQASALPAPIRGILNPIVRMPKWYREDLREQFGYLYDQGPEEVTSLDLLNSVTSPLNYRNQVQGENRNRQFFTTEKLVTPLAQLVAFNSLG